MLHFNYDDQMMRWNESKLLITNSKLLFVFWFHKFAAIWMICDGLIHQNNWAVEQKCVGSVCNMFRRFVTTTTTTTTTISKCVNIPMANGFLFVLRCTRFLFWAPQDGYCRPIATDSKCYKHTKEPIEARRYN